MTAVILPAVLMTLFISKPMAAYQLGETHAKSVGVNVGRFRIVLVVLSSLLAACVTAFAGPVSFVGIAVPHVAARLFGTSRPVVMIPACFLGGGVFCLFSDLLARTIFSPTELSISTVTAVFGAPVVIFILVRRKAGE
jgi:iron complex transport system permease protein